jgi:hypothetical protein
MVDHRATPTENHICREFLSYRSYYPCTHTRSGGPDYWECRDRLGMDAMAFMTDLHVVVHSEAAKVSFLITCRHV